MNKSTKYLLVLVGTVALFAMALSLVGPALAQSGTGGSTPQAGATVALQSGDTLGVLVDRYSLSGNNLRDFVVLNSGLKLESGQTINYPAGVTVDTSGQSASGSTGGQTVTDAQLLEFVTLNRDLSFASDQSVVLPASVPATGAANTPAATLAATLAATNTVEATATQSGAANANTYVTKTDDTLGMVLGFMGFQVIPATGENATATGTSAAGVTATATSATGGEVATATPAAGVTPTATSAAGGVVATATPAAGVTPTATPAAGGTTATATPVAGCEANYTVKAGDTLTAIAQRCGITLQQLVDANPSLLQAGSTLNIPASSGNTSGGTSGSTGSTGNIPQTGGSQAQVGEGSLFGLNLNLMPDTVQRGEGVYVVRSGDSLSSIARHFNTTVEWLLSHNNNILNANLIFRGQHMVVPQGEFPGVWNYQLLEQQAAQLQAAK